jgi:uncharacterized protein (DUF885 family)
MAHSRSRPGTALILGLCVLTAHAAAGDAPPAASPSPVLDASGSWRRGRSAALLAILDEHVEWRLAEDPLEASRRGDHRFDAMLPDVSPAAVEQRLGEVRDRLGRLKALDRAGFTEQDRLDADLLAYELERMVEAAPFHREQFPIDARSGVQVSLPQMADSLPIRTPADRAAYAARLEGVPALIDGTIEQMRAGLRAGRVPPRVVMLGTPEQAELLATDDVAKTPALSPFHGPFNGLPAGDESAARAKRAIAGGIVPAYRRLAAFLRDEYLPKCRETVGYSQGVDGPGAYEQALRAHTTTDLGAERIHALGLSEVARLRAEMIRTIGRTGFDAQGREGDALLAAFVEHLRTDPRFTCATPEELLAGYREICKRMDAELPRLFGTLPRLTYGVRELPALAAPSAPTAYYYPGSMAGGVPAWFMANTYRLDQRPRYEMVPLALHEAVPGHHLQIALAQELSGQHPFRTFGGYTAFVEGWGLYAESLGLEVGGRSPGDGGMYADPYDDFGRLSYEMWRACRLVVDTGMHAEGWTRERAIEYMERNTSLSRLNIEREIDRYIAWPGQACAYKIGQLKIRELRTRAEGALGERFDVRAFHDAVLDAGAIPLPALEAKIGRWIEGRKG